jgi:hypothetical protein
MTTEYRATRKEVTQDLTFNLKHIERSLQNDLERVTALVEALQNWSAKAPEDLYDGEAAGRIRDLLCLTNNSGWISYLESAIRESSIKKADL